MNRYPETTPYIFRPPKYSRFWAPLIYAISDFFYLHRLHKIVDVTVCAGGQELLERIRKGDSVLITPNHSDHADPQVLLHLNRELKIPVHFVAARETFDVNRGFNGMVLQRAGVFSIDREGADIAALKEAMRIVYEGRYPLVMFPEGEIYHLNDQLTPLNQGAATIMLKTAAKLRKEGKQQGCWIIPTAIQYSYVDDISATFPTAMKRLEKHILWAPQEQLDIVARIYKFGEALLSLKEKELFDCTLSGPLPSRLEQFRELLIGGLEEKYFAKKDAKGGHPERIRKLRGKIRSILLDETPPPKETVNDCYRDLDKLFLAIQSFSYPGQYVRDGASMKRIAETIVKFEEDVFGEYTIKGNRKAQVTFCDPIDVFAYIDSQGKASKTAATELTNRMEAVIQAALI